MEVLAANISGDYFREKYFIGHSGDEASAQRRGPGHAIAAAAAQRIERERERERHGRKVREKRQGFARRCFRAGEMQGNRLRIAAIASLAHFDCGASHSGGKE